ncbi:MAG: hypothetical protein PHW47_11885 [Lachnospira sp.]|nr:hypothetical protein [Lachnospira sp.]
MKRSNKACLVEMKNKLTHEKEYCILDIMSGAFPVRGTYEEMLVAYEQINAFFSK